MNQDLMRWLYNNEDSWADDHLSLWRDRYYRLSRTAVCEDLRINYDWSCEFERIEAELGRELDADEQELVCRRLIACVKKVFYK